MNPFLLIPPSFMVQFFNRRVAAFVALIALLTQTATGAIPLPLTGQADAVAEAQSTNLVVNGSFEDSPVFTSGQCASTHKGMTSQYVTGWDRAYTGIGPSPGNYDDQYHYANLSDTRCTIYVGPPNYPVANTPFTEIASDGYRMHSGWIGGGYAEYFQGSLSQALVPGQIYTMSFDIAGKDLSGISQYLGNYVGQTLYMGVDFYETKQLFNGNFTTSLSASSNMVSIPAIVLSANYKTVTVQFTATNAARYFVVGAFAGMGGSPAYVMTDNYKVMQVGGSSSSVPSCVPFTGSLRNVAGLQSVKIGEMSQPVIAVTNNFPTFGVNDAKLVTDIPVEGGSANDFASPGSSEYYDFYYSNADGTLNANGSYITIDNWRYNNLSNSAVGNNIDGVELSFGNGQKVYAGLVASTRPGTGLSGEYANGKAENALGGFDNKVTYMGDQKSSFTVGFCQNDIPTSSSSSSSIISQCPVNLRHANVILSSTGVPSRGNPANTLLGAPGGANDSVNFDNDGNTAGFVKVGFPAPIVNGPGADFVLSYEDPDEDFEVFVYDQNGNKASVGYIARKYPYHTHTVEQVELPFDISGTGFSSVVAVEVVNRESKSSVDVSEGPDIRGFTSVYCGTQQSSSSSTPLPQCRDGIDNDGDGRIDYNNGLGDYGCDSPDDPTESPNPECSDGVDNADGEDTLADAQDPGCYTNGFYDPRDPSESNTPSTPACENLVQNGSFEQGGVGFSTEYVLKTSCAGQQYTPDYGQVFVNNNPQTCHNLYTPSTDHGNMLIVNSAPVQKNFWCQTVNVQPNTNYRLNYDLRAAVTYQSLNTRVQWMVNGSSIGSSVQAPASWNSYTADWYSGNTQTATICGKNADTEYETLDFVIDNIGFRVNENRCNASSSSSTPLPQCRDGIDNDGDGRVDYANGNGDYGCDSPDDPTENPNPECSDGVDNGDPEDSVADALDPGCHTDGDPFDGDNTYDPRDPSENNGGSSSSSSSSVPQCRDGIDNDGDGRVDYQNGNGDYGCDSNDDPTENPNPECSDGVDNGDPEDSLADANDPGCHTDGDPNDGDNTYDPRDPSENDGGNPDFDIEVDDDEDEVEPEDDVTYVVEVTNKSNQSISNVTVTVELDRDVNFDDCSDDCDDDDETITWTGLHFNGNETKYLTIDAEVDEDAEDGDELKTEARVFNERDTDKTDVEEDGVKSDKDDDEADVEVMKDSSTSEVFPGGMVQYTVRVRNTGDTDLEDITVTDTLPMGVQVIDDGRATRSSGGRLVWEIDQLDQGDTWSVSYRVSVPQWTAPGTILRNDVRVMDEEGSVNVGTIAIVSVIGFLPQTGGDVGGLFTMILSLVGAGAGMGMRVGKKIFI